MILATIRAAPDASEAADTVGEVADDARTFGAAIVDRLPVIATAIAVGLIALVLALLLARVVERTLARTRADHVAVVLLSRLVRLLGIIGALLLMLSVAGPGRTGCCWCRRG
jgi:hypothetical protein